MTHRALRRPERFLNGEAGRRPPGAYMPFGVGPRDCIGMKFALEEMTISLVRWAGGGLFRWLRQQA